MATCNPLKHECKHYTVETKNIRVIKRGKKLSDGSWGKDVPNNVKAQVIKDIKNANPPIDDSIECKDDCKCNIITDRKWSEIGQKWEFKFSVNGVKHVGGATFDKYHHLEIGVCYKPAKTKSVT